MAPSSTSEDRHPYLTLRSHCICKPLHRSCNPNTCSEAPNLEAGNLQPQTILPGSTSNLGKEALVETTLKNLNGAALSGCLTCGILYAGMKAPLHEDSSWVAEMQEEKVFVTIGESPDFVQVYSFADGTEAWKYTAFTFYATEGSDYLASCNAFSEFILVSNRTDSAASFKGIKRWIEDCKTHPLCVRPETRFFPTRVIDIGPWNDSEYQPHVLEPRGIVADYIALSHCWGNRQILTTTTETMQSRKAGIDLLMLSQVFRDAILVARRLHIRYLWIDSLCIIQDDEKDWQTESAKMASIYKYALLTIAAHVAIGGQGSLFSATPELDGKTSWEITARCNWSSLEEGSVVASRSIGNQGASNVGSGSRYDRISSVSPVLHLGHPGNTRNEIASRHYYPSKDHIETASKGSAENITSGGYCIALFDSMATEKVKLHYVSGTHYKSISPEHVPFSAPNKPSGIFARMRDVHILHDLFARENFPSYPADRLASRAWVFQERLLSTRILSYTDLELVWECRTVASCQCNSITNYGANRILSKLTAGMWPGQDEGLDHSFKLAFEESISFNRTPEELLEAWMSVVFHYTPLYLSYPSDRLPALSGLAKLFQEDGRLGTYAAGLWSLYASRLISWDVGPTPLKRPVQFSAPTWSWASVIGGVHFPYKFVLPNSPSRIASQSEIVGQIVQVQCTPAGLDPTGAVSGGRITVSGKTTRAKLRKTQEDPLLKINSVMYRGYSVIHENSGIESSFVPDSLSDFDTLEGEYDVICLLWTIRDGPFKGIDDIVWTSCSLVLRLASHTTNLYTRLGLLSLWDCREEEPIVSPSTPHGIFEYDDLPKTLRVSGPGQRKEPTIQDWYKDAEEIQLVII